MLSKGGRLRYRTESGLEVGARWSGAVRAREAVGGRRSSVVGRLRWRERKLAICSTSQQDVGFEFVVGTGMLCG